LDEQSRNTERSKKIFYKSYLNKKNKDAVLVGSIVAITGALAAAVFAFIFSRTDKETKPTVTITNINNIRAADKVKAGMPKSDDSANYNNASYFQKKTQSVAALQSDSVKKNAGLLLKNVIVHKQKNIRGPRKEQIKINANGANTKVNEQVVPPNVPIKRNLGNRYSETEYPQNDEPVIDIDSTVIRYDGYPLNRSGIIFWSNCRNCEWHINLVGGIITYHYLISATEPTVMPVEYYPVYGGRPSVFYIKDKSGKRYPNFELKATAGKTIVVQIAKRP